MAKFDSPEPFTLSEKLITATGIILVQPLLFLVMSVPGLPRMFSGFLGYLLYIVNSLLWAVILVVLVGKIYELLQRRKSKDVIQTPSYDDRKER
jgi:uncharacterized membrane protein